MRSIFIPALILFALPAFATEEKGCGTVRLDQNGGPFAELPVYDQSAFAGKRDTGICYAVTASQLIDAERFRRLGKLPTQLTAPVPLAAGAKLQSLAWNEMEVVTEGRVEEAMGNYEIEKTLRYAAANGMCDQNWLDQFDASVGATNKYPADILPEYERLFPSKRNFLRAITAEIDHFRAKPLPFLAGLRGLKPKPEITEDFFSCTIETNQLPIKDILTAIEAGAAYGTPLGQMHEFLRSICAKHSFRAEIPEPKLLEREKLMQHDELDMEPYRTGAMEAKVHELLNSRPPKPVAANFCYSALEEKGAGRMNDDRLGYLHFKNCVFHSAPIIGRRFDPGTKTCQFLVRDSFGPGCKKTDGKPRYDWECSGGNIWIDARELMSATGQLTWL